MWRTRQVGNVVHAFRDECIRADPDTWTKVRVSYALLVERGPVASGVCVKLTNGKGLWELKAKNDSIQPRLLFYVVGDLVVFVYCFMKKNNSMYKHAIEIGNKRRKQAERGEVLNVIETRVH